MTDLETCGVEGVIVEPHEFDGRYIHSAVPSDDGEVMTFRIGCRCGELADHLIHVQRPGTRKGHR